jgi:transcriptional regulator with XRE-family HTH domain
MGQILEPANRQVKANGAKRRQVSRRGPGVIPGFQQLPEELVERVTFNMTLNEAARYSGLEDQEIAEQIHISPGYMSRFMRGVAYRWAQRLVEFMNETCSIAPLQWMAYQVGCVVVPRSSIVDAEEGPAPRHRKYPGATVA